MSFIEKLDSIWRLNRSMLCVGLDPDINKIPEYLKNSNRPIFQFNKEIIDATAEHVCAFKPQIAYYSGQNAENELKETIKYIKENYPEIPVILDAKRGDIGNTAQMYAKEAFEIYQADAVTVNPYMGTDSIQPFTQYKDKGTVILCRTSNPGGDDLQNRICNKKTIYEVLANFAENEWNKNNNIMLVIGATYPEELGKIRRICPDIPFLVPGIGAQGGDIKKVIENGLDSNGLGLVINSSRGIIYAGDNEDFALKAANSAIKLKNTINYFRKKVL